MSFILDALRKSEHERQRQAGPGFAELRPAIVRTGFPRWAIALGALLAVNLVVLAVLMLRNGDPIAPASQPATPAETPPSTASPAPAPGNPSAPGATAMLSEGIPERASGSRSSADPAWSRSESRAIAEDEAARFEDYAAEEPAESEPELQPPPRATPTDDESVARLPTINDIAMEGAKLPELHLDIHVYATQPAERFVFLNSRKYREGGETPEGTMIERITRDGVVLNHRGVRFLLPRQ